MINQFRTTLMNIAEASPVVFGDYISPGFAPVTLATPMLNFYQLLFPSSSRNDIVQRANSYTALLTSCGLASISKMGDDRITYFIEDLADFGTPSNNLTVLADTIIGNTDTINMLAYGENCDLYIGYYNNSPIKLQRLAGVIASYCYKLL